MRRASRQGRRATGIEKRFGGGSGAAHWVIPESSALAEPQWWLRAEVLMTVFVDSGAICGRLCLQLLGELVADAGASRSSVFERGGCTARVLVRPVLPRQSE